MSTKDWAYKDDKRFKLYQQVTNEEINSNPAIFEIAAPENISIASIATTENTRSDLLTVEIPAEILDDIAIAWCKKRRLQGALAGPVGREFGSPDCEYE